VSGLGYNYPAGAELDPSAPWNLSDDTGESEAEARDRRAWEKADYDRDAEIDRRLCE